MSKTVKKYRHPKAKISFRHNILPVVLGFMMFGSVLALLNSEWIVAQAEYRFAPKVSAAEVEVQAHAKAPKDSVQLSIPSINVDAPVQYESSMAEWKIQIALRSGVVHLGSTAMPGENGNVVIIGHSSGQAWAPGNYKFIFTLLGKVQKNNLITLDYKGTRYIYRVTSTEVVEPTNFSVIQPTSDPQLTLITCTPVGTSKQRLVVHARQVSPNPVTQSATSQTATSSHNLTKLPQ